MPITITVTGETHSEVLTHLKGLGGSAAPAAAVTTAVAPAAAKLAVEEKKPEAKTEPAAKPKAEPKPKAPKAAEVEDDGKPVYTTLTGCRIMAKRVAAAVGMQTFLDILAGFKKEKIGDLAEGDYAAFIEQCQAKIDGSAKTAEAGSGLFE